MKRSPLPGPPLDRLPDHVKLGIHSVVGDKVVATGEPEPDATYTVCVGQVGQHLATSNVRILAVQWVHSGGGPVAGYTATPNAGIIMPVTPQMLGSNPVTFAWSIGGPAVVGVYIKTAHGTGYARTTLRSRHRK